MRLYLKTYSQEASSILHQAMLWHLNSGWSHELEHLTDNELVYIDNKRANDSATVLRRRLTRVLSSYVDGPPKFRRQDVDQAEEIKKANCLRLIVNERYEQAAQEFPDIYPALKGKPLDIIKSTAVSTLMAQIKEVELELDRLRFHTVTVAQVRHLQEAKQALWQQVYKMRGFELDESTVEAFMEDS